MSLGRGNGDWRQKRKGGFFSPFVRFNTWSHEKALPVNAEDNVAKGNNDNPPPVILKWVPQVRDLRTQRDPGRLLGEGVTLGCEGREGGGLGKMGKGASPPSSP